MRGRVCWFVKLVGRGDGSNRSDERDSAYRCRDDDAAGVEAPDKGRVDRAA
jgi:hypothetical protein